MGQPGCRRRALVARVHACAALRAGIRFGPAGSGGNTDRDRLSAHAEARTELVRSGGHERRCGDASM
jgi:hypothetical protein